MTAGGRAVPGARRHRPVVEVVLAVAFVGLLALVVLWDGPPGPDLRVFANSPPASDRYYVGWLHSAAQVVADAGEPVVWTLGSVLLAALVALARRSWFPFRLVAVPVAVDAVLVGGLKAVVDRPGPPGPAGGSGFFPSGHTATALVCAGALAALLTIRRPAWARVLRVVVVAWSVLVAASLVYVGYHWLTDVLGSLLLGLLILRVGCRPLWAPSIGSGDDPAAEDDTPRLREDA